MPLELALGGDIICPISEFSLKTRVNQEGNFSIPPSYYYVAFLMRKYAGLSLPAEIPAELPPFKEGYPQLTFNITDEKLTPLPSGDNRLAFGLALASEEPYCEDEFDPEYCEVKSTFSLDMVHPARVALKGFGYGLLEDSMTRGLKTICGLPEDSAYRFTRDFEIMLKGVLDRQITSSLILLAVETGLEYSPVSARNKKQAQTAVTALLFLSAWLPQLFELDFQEQLLIFSATLLSLFTHAAGRRISEMFYEKMNQHHFFFHRALSPSPASLSRASNLASPTESVPELEGQRSRVGFKGE